MKKRGVSTIITVIVIILVVLSAFVLVWSLVKKFVSGGANQLGLDQFGVSLTTNPTNLSHDPVAVSVTRNAGWGNVSAIKIVFRNDTSSYTYMNDTKVPDVLETVIYYVPLAQIGFVPLSFDVYPVISTPSGTVTGMKAGGGGGGSGGGGGGTGTTTPPGTITCYGNLDGDGYYNGTAATFSGSSCPAGYNTSSEINILEIDCDDNNSAINPGVIEDGSIDGIDENCDGGDNIDRCGNLINANSIYFLKNDLSKATGSCFTVLANNITLDMRGFSITGDVKPGNYNYGVSITSKNFTTVKNGKIRQMNSAVYLYLDSDNNTITNLTLENNTIGVLVRNASSGNMITDIIITNINTTINYYGVYLLSSSTSNVVMRVKESRSKTGILIENSQNNIIKDNILDSNDLAGIHITDSANGNIIEGNTLNSSYMAIEIYSGIYNIISKNSLNNNNKSLYLYGQRDRDFNNMITIDNIVGSSHRIYYNYSISNYVFDSTNSGDADEVVCIKCDNVVIKDLDLSTTGAEGVYLYNTTNSVIKNVSIRNKEIGVYTKFGYNNNMTNNKACGNLVRDFYCDSSTGNFGTGNNFTLVTSVSCSGWPVSGVDYSPCGGGATCNDSDGGIDYYVRGTVYASAWGGVPIDEGCPTSALLRELYCNSFNQPASVDYTCPNGCQDGACIP